MYVLSSSNVSQSFAHPDFAGIEKRAETEINMVHSNVNDEDFKKDFKRILKGL